MIQLSFIFQLLLIKNSKNIFHETQKSSYKYDILFQKDDRMRKNANKEKGKQNGKNE